MQRDENRALDGGTGPDSRPEEMSAPPEFTRERVIQIVIFDLAVLFELTLAMYTANALRQRWDFTLVFCVVFIGLLIPTILISRFFTRRRLRRLGSEDGLPGQPGSHPPAVLQ